MASGQLPRALRPRRARAAAASARLLCLRRSSRGDTGLRPAPAPGRSRNSRPELRAGPCRGKAAARDGGPRGELPPASRRAGAEPAGTPGFPGNWGRIQTQSSLGIRGQDHSYAGAEERGEGRQQPRAVSQRGRAGPPTPAPPSLSPTRGTRPPQSPLPRAQGTSDGRAEAPRTWHSGSGRPSAWRRWCNAGTRARPPASRSRCAGRCLQEREESAPARAAAGAGPPSLGAGTPGFEPPQPKPESEPCWPWGSPRQPMKSPAPGRLSESSQKCLCQDLPRSQRFCSCTSHCPPAGLREGWGNHPYS